MTRALISVSDDGFTYISLNGATSRYSDTGQAIAYLGDYARETATALSVTIDDGAKKTEVSIDENGKLASSSARAGSGAGAESDAEATDSADRADQRTDAEATASAAGTQPRAAAGSSQTADSPESTEQPTPAESSDGADSSDGGESSGDAAGAAEAADGSAEATADGGEGYPLGTPFSGPAAPAAPKVKKTRVRKHSKRSPRNRPQRLKKITVPGLVLIGLAILMVGAFVVPNIVPVDSSETPQTIGSEQQLNPASELSVDDTDDVVPSFDNSPTWETEVPKRDSVTAADHGALLVYKNRLEVLDADTGKTRYKTTIDEAPTFAVDTVIDGQPALPWQSGDTAEALFDGEKEPKSYQLPQDARITSAGKSVLIKSGNQL